MKHTVNRSLAFISSGLAVVAMAASIRVRADEVTDWNENMFTAVFTANTIATITTRVTAMVQSAVFDAVNGVYKRYDPVHVPAEAPPGTSARAAAVQAAHDTLVHLYPAQQTRLDAQLAASLANLTDEPGGVYGKSVARGVQWGHYVAEQIWAWRSADGFTPPPPPFTGGTNIGQWRPTPPAFAPGAVPQFAYMVPWAIPSQALFLVPGPNTLTSAQYATDLNESKLMGRVDSLARTADQTLFSRFWNGNTPGFWNRTAVQLAERYDFSLLEKAHLLALMNIAEADGIICCWQAKYTFVAWRPVTAIPLADLDGNPDTSGDPTWTPLLITPAHPEYPSGHSTASGASAAVLAAFFGDNTDFSVTSETALGVTRNYSSFSSAELEIRDARVFGGIHFRTACIDGQALGKRVAAYVLDNALQPIHGSPPLGTPAEQ